MDAMAFPHRVAPFPHLSAVVDLPRPSGFGDWRRRAGRTTTAPPRADRGGGREGGTMTETAPRQRSGGRDARRAARLHAHVEREPFLTRTMAPFEVLTDEGLSIIERNADTILQEVGLEFRGDPGALELLKDAGADVDGERVRFPRGLARQLVQATAPRQFTQYARNEANNVEIGGMHTVLAPNYGSPFVRDLDNGRRYGTIEDFRNLVKLTYLSPHLHHSGGTVCEPVDVPVNKRHLDMVYSHIRYSDKPFMGSVTAPERARDTVEMARITFGADYLETHPGDPQPDQRELAARLGLGDARRRPGLRRGEPGDAADAVHPRRRDGAGDRRRRSAPRRSPRRWAGWPSSSSSGRARRSCSGASPPRSRCSRARRRSARRSPRSSST